MKDETLTQKGIAFIVISGVCWAIFAGISLILFLPLEIVASVFFVAVAAAVVAIALALFVIRKQEKEYQMGEERRLCQKQRTKRVDIRRLPQTLSFLKAFFVP